MSNPFNFENYVPMSEDEREEMRKNFEETMASIGIKTTDIPKNVSYKESNYKEVWIVK